jgi:hypothetical protein
MRSKCGKKTLRPAVAPSAAALLSLSLSLSFFPLFSLSNVDDTYYTASKGALEGGTTGTKRTVVNPVP